MMLTQEDLCLRMNKYVLKSWNERKENELRAHFLSLGWKQEMPRRGKPLPSRNLTPAQSYREYEGYLTYKVTDTGKSLFYQ